MRNAKLALTTALVAALFAPLLSSVAAPARDWKSISKPPLPAFSPQQPRRVELANGMLLLLQEDHELPLIRGTGVIRGGARDEPSGKVGLVDIYGQTWRTGGTAKRSGDDLDDFLEMRAAKVETAGDRDSSSISWDCLTERFDDVFGVVEQLLRTTPAFPADKIDLAKQQVMTSIARRNDDLDEIATREALKLVYGPDSPYARVPELATVAAITRDDLVAWHRSHVHPNNIILGVSGDFDSAAMIARIERAFADWPRGPAAPRTDVSVPEPRRGVFFINKEDVQQCEIRLVDLGARRDNPDYYALEVMNEIFGGGFSSRLFSNVRTKQGLAYAVGGGVGASYDHPGMLHIRLATKNESMGSGIDALYQEIDDLLAKPVSADELARAKDSLLNSFIFRIDSKDKVLRQQLIYALYGYPADFLERYRAGIERVTAEDVSRIARAYVHKDRMSVLIVGKLSAFDRPPSAVGPAREIDVTIPGLDALRP